MKFKPNMNGEMELVRHRNVLSDMRESFPLSTAYIVDVPTIKESIKHMDFVKGKTLSLVFPVAIGTAGVVASTGGAGVIWHTFMNYVFPWLIDIAKVFCVVKIAQGFYDEKRGGKDGSGGFGTFVTYGKWLLFFHLIPWGVTLIDQLGIKMVHDLQINPIK